MSQYRSAGALACHTRIRAGFPREFSVARSMARDRPSPYAEGGAVLRRRNPPNTGARGPVPRERPVARSLARDRPSPYAEGGRFSTQKPSQYCSAGACPPRTAGSPQPGEGQALALRGRGRFSTQKPSQYCSAGPSDATRASERVSPATLSDL